MKALLIMATVLSMTVPVTYEDGSPLPANTALGINIYDADGDVVLVSGFALPGTQFTKNAPKRYGCWEATAVRLDNGIESARSEQACKLRALSGCYAICHQ